MVVSAFFCCHKVPDTSQLSNNFVVITNRDKSANFGDYKTFFISDTVAYISNTPGDDSIIVGDPAHVLINAVKTNLISNNYLQQCRFCDPDLGVKVTAIKQLSGGVIYPPGWWWGYPGYPGPCYWNICYPGYYPYPIAYAYHVGDLIVEVYDLKNASANRELRVVWVADAGGVLTGMTQTDIDKTISAIDQAFDQSPYFKTN